MIIAGFGSTWAGAYQFPSSDMADEWSQQRPVVSQRVNGLDGEFDHWGDEPFPLANATVTKRFALTGTAWADIETALTTLRAALQASTVENKLWALQRDGTYRWAWAKVDRVSAPDRVGQILHCPVEIVFSLREGLWYSESAHSDAFTTTGTHTLTNNGKVRAPVKVTIAPAGANIVAFAVAATGQGWAWAGVLSSPHSLIVDAGGFSCLNNGTDEFDLLTITDPFTFWLYADPGTTTITITRTQGGGGTFVATFEYWDTWA